jgi:glycosyltransferase involved in cell wall biosynthesis
MGEIKKIVWFNREFCEKGGGERLILEGLKHFESVGIESYLLTFTFDRKALFDGIYKPEIIEITQKDNQSTENFLLKIISPICKTLALRKKIKNIKPDFIITQGQWNHNISLYLATLFPSFPYVVHIFGSMFTFSDEFSKYAMVFRKHFNEVRESMEAYKEIIPTKLPKIGVVKRLRLERDATLRYFVNRKSKKIFVLSNQNKWEVKKLYHKDAVVLKGAFPASIFEYNPNQDIKQKLGLSDKKMVLSVCRLIPKKRVDLCIKAFREVSDKIEDVVLVIGGTGPDENRLKTLAQQLDLESKVQFIGFIPENELWDYYACCDVFVHMDLADFDIAPLEALALRRKVIWSTEMELDEFLTGNQSIFPTDCTVDSVVTTMNRAINTELKTMDLTTKQKLYHFTWENYFDGILKELEKTVKHD